MGIRVPNGMGSCNTQGREMEDDWGDAGKTLVCRQATEPNVGIGIETPVEANSGLCDGRSDTALLPYGYITVRLVIWFGLV